MVVGGGGLCWWWSVLVLVLVATLRRCIKVTVQDVITQSFSELLSSACSPQVSSDAWGPCDAKGKVDAQCSKLLQSIVIIRITIRKRRKN